jgi:hypothetical protein
MHPYLLQFSELGWIKNLRFSFEIPRKQRVKVREKLKNRAKPHEKRTKSRFIPPFGSDQSAHAALL